MRLFKTLTAVIFLLLCSCGKKEEPAYVPKPVIEASFEKFQGTGIVVSLRTVNTDAVYGLVQKASEATPSADEIAEKGVKAENGELFIDGLEMGTDYIAYIVGKMKDSFSSIESFSFTSRSLYPWEADRTEIMTFADMDLLPGGDANKTPNTWDENRLKPHVTFTDTEGREQWLHEAFLMIGGQINGKILCVDAGELISADQSDWSDFIDYWFRRGGVADMLDRTVGNAIGRIGKPSFGKHKIIITMPDPIKFKLFRDRSSSTTYWGKIYDTQLDFSRPDDQIKAYKWFIDQVREAWMEISPENLELAGFYVLSEILECPPDGYNWENKRWHEILPEVSDYLHEMNYGLYWIPYYQADGYDKTSRLGIDYTWLQPNEYWDYPEKKQKKEWSWIFRTMQTYGHGMEIEFEGSHGEPGWSQWESGVPRTSSSILETVRTDYDAQGTRKGSPNPQAARNKQLLRDYMNEFKKAGYYGKARIATYSGTNGMYELATSPDEKDRQMYLEYCDFIVNSPLRKQK